MHWCGSLPVHVNAARLAWGAWTKATLHNSGSAGAILDQSNRLVDASNPATPGSTVLQAT
jgi:hypothetical protein